MEARDCPPPLEEGQSLGIKQPHSKGTDVPIPRVESPDAAPKTWGAARKLAGQLRVDDLVAPDLIPHAAGTRKKGRAWQK